MRKLVAATRVVDVEAGAVHADRDIWCEDGQISAIETASTDAGPGQPLDGRGLYAIPGLIDTHVHSLGVMTEDVPGPFDLGWVHRQQKKNLRSFLHGGVTTIRDLGAPLKLIRRLSRQQRELRLPAPRILFSGPVLTAPGGYPDFLPPTPWPLRWLIGPLRIDVADVSQARATVSQLARAGVHCVKVMYQTMRYDDQRTRLPALSRELLTAIIDASHEQGLPVALHQTYRADLLDVLELPFDTLEHLPIDEPLTGADAEAVARRGIPVTTTMMTYGIIDHVERLKLLLAREPQRFEAKPRRFLQRTARGLAAREEVSRFIGHRVILTGSTHQRESLRRLHAAGATISFGTDSGGAITPPGCPHWELLDMVRAGLSSLEALRTATTTAAAAIGREDLGRLKPGAPADLVLLARDPLEDIAAVGEVVAVFQGGRLAHRRR